MLPLFIQTLFHCSFAKIVLDPQVTRVPFLPAAPALWPGPGRRVSTGRTGRASSEPVCPTVSSPRTGTDSDGGLPVTAKLLEAGLSPGSSQGLLDVTGTT